MTSVFAKFEDFLAGAVVPWLENFFKAEEHALLAALAPIFEKAAADAADQLSKVQSPTDLATVLASTFGSALTEAEQKGLQVTAVTALQAFGGAVANLQAPSVPPTPAMVYPHADILNPPMGA